MSEDKHPLLKIKDGLLEVAVFENKTEDGKTVFNHQLSRSYQDGDGNWKRTNSLSGMQPLAASKMLERSYVEVAKVRAERRSQSQGQRESEEHGIEH
ncbi:MAG: hypothetical protein AAF066_16355 [Pseudomonadota bacterium]